MKRFGSSLPSKVKISKLRSARTYFLGVRAGGNRTGRKIRLRRNQAWQAYEDTEGGRGPARAPTNVATAALRRVLKEHAYEGQPRSPAHKAAARLGGNQ